MKDISVAIIEDDVANAKQLKTCIKRVFEPTEYNPIISQFDSAEDFLSSKSLNAFQLVFMDIDLPGIDGLSAAAKFRETNTRSILIFVTNMSQFAIRGYSVEAMDFIVKPMIYNDFVFKMQRVLKALRTRVSAKVSIDSSKGMRFVSTEDIIYVEVKNHDLYWYLKNETVKESSTLASAEKRLLSAGFLRPNRSYLVNPSYITGVSGYTLIIGNDNLPISRPQKKQFMHELNEFVRKGGK